MQILCEIVCVYIYTHNESSKPNQNNIFLRKTTTLTRRMLLALISTGHGAVQRISVISRKGSSAWTASTASNWTEPLQS